MIHHGTRKPNAPGRTRKESKARTSSGVRPAGDPSSGRCGSPAMVELLGPAHQVGDLQRLAIAANRALPAPEATHPARAQDSEVNARAMHEDGVQRQVDHL